MKLLFLTCFFLISTFTLFASQDTVVLPIVQVFPTHNYPLRNIDSTTWRNFSLASVSELIKYQTPVFIKNYGVGQLSSLSFRGTGARHTKVFWEEIPLNSPMLGELDMSLIPAFYFDHAELHLGGNNLEQGSGAIGAQINLETNSLKEGITFSEELSSLLNSNSHFQYHYTGNQFASNTKLLYHFGANRFQYRNKLQVNKPKTNAKHSDFRQTGFMQSLQFNLNNKNTLTGKIWYHHSNRDLEFPNANQKDNYQRSFLEWKRFTNKNTTSVKTAWLREQFTYLDTLESHATKLFAKIKHQLSLPHSLFLNAGIDLSFNQAEADGYRSGVSQNQVAGYAILTSETWNKFLWKISLREILVDQQWSPLLYSIQASYKPIADKLYFRINHSRNYNFPTINSQFWQPGGNHALKPEKSLGLELSLLSRYQKKEHWQYAAELSIYHNTIDNWIQWSPIDGQQYWSAQNLKKVLNQGIETNLKFDFFLNKSILGITGIYTINSSINKSTYGGSENLEGKQLIYTPKFQWKGILSWRWKGWSAYYHQQYTHLRYTTSDNFTSLPGFYFGSLSIDHYFKLKSINLSTKLTIDNIFNADYEVVSGRPMPLRTVILGFDINF